MPGYDDRYESTLHEPDRATLMTEAINTVYMPVANGDEPDDPVAAAVLRMGLAISAALLEVSYAIKEMTEEMKGLSSDVV